MLYLLEQQIYRQNKQNRNSAIDRKTFFSDRLGNFSHKKSRYITMSIMTRQWTMNCVNNIVNVQQQMRILNTRQILRFCHTTSSDL